MIARASHRATLLLVVSSLGGCALAMPSATFGSTTPEARTDVAAGAAVRVATGDLRGDAIADPEVAAHREAVDARGIAPMAMARYGLGEHLDLGIVASGTALRFDVRGEHVLDEDSTRPALVFGVAPSYAYVAPPSGTDGGAHLIAIEPVFAFGVDFGGIYDVWVGPRAILGGLVGEFEGTAGGLERARALRMDLGGTFGFAAGFRRVHGFVELSALYERFWGRQGSVSLDRGGLVLLPAFGLRVRI